MQLPTSIKEATLTANGDHQRRPNLDIIQLIEAQFKWHILVSASQILSHSSCLDGPGTIVEVDSGKIIQTEYLEVCSATDFPRNGDIYKTRSLAVSWTKEVSWSHKYTKTIGNW